MYMQKSKQAKIRSILGKVKQWERGEPIKRDNEKEKIRGKIEEKELKWYV